VTVLLESPNQPDHHTLDLQIILTDDERYHLFA